MVCNQCQELISDYIDGLLELGEQVRVERHLADCEPCRAVRDDLLQIVHFSRQLPDQTPSSVIWSRIQAEIANEPPKGFWTRVTNWAGQAQNRYFNLSIPQMAASAVALAVVVSAAVLFLRNNSAALQTPVTNFQASGAALDRNLLSTPDVQQIEQRIDQLKASVEERKSTWNPELRVAFDRNMYYIDQSLLECRQELSNNPADEVSKELMLNAYREKVRLLEGFRKY